MEKKPSPTPTLSKAQVAGFLKENPLFFKEHPELFELLATPEKDLGEGVVDLQHYMVGNLQKNIRKLKSRYDVLLTSARDNMSTQMQVHNAVLGLIKARSLESLLEVITVDLQTLFDVDVVRLGMESEAAEIYDTFYSENTYSGITFIEPGLVNAALGASNDVLLVEDAKNTDIAGFDQIFADCDALIHSCALLRLELTRTRRNVLLAFGVRHSGRFTPGQGIDMLSFLAQIVEHRLDECLSETELEKLP